MKKFKNIYLHFGADKTGSTTIQYAFDRHREWILREQRLAYGPGAWQPELGSYFSPEPEAFIYNQLAGQANRDVIQAADAQYFNAFEEWLGRIDNCDSLLISYEGFVNLSPKALSNLANYCSTLAEHCTVVMYVRAPLSYAISAMSQRVKQSIPSWQEDAIPFCPYDDFLQNIVPVFGKKNIRVKEFSRNVLLNGDVLADFLQTIGIDPGLSARLMQGAEEENVSLSKEAIQLSDAVLAAAEELGVRSKRGIFYDYMSQALLSLTGQKMTLEPGQAHAVVESAAQSVEYLRNEFGIVFAEDESQYIRKEDIDAGEVTLKLKSLGEFVLKTLPIPKVTRPDWVAPGFELKSVSPDSGGAYQSGTSIRFQVRFKIDRDIHELVAGIHILDENGEWAFGTNSELLGVSQTNLEAGCHESAFLIIADLPEGNYTTGFGFVEKTPEGENDLAWYEGVVSFSVAARRTTPSVGYCSLPVAYTRARLT